MKTRMFAIYDVKAQMYNAPFFMPSVGMAIRAFSDLVNDAQSMVAKHPEDYQLFEVGGFDDNSGEASSVTPVKFISSAVECVVRKPVFPMEMQPCAEKDGVADGSQKVR